MVEARSIETLSVSFTAGVILGAMLSGSSSMLPCTLLILIALPCFLREKLLHLPDAQSLGILLATFLLLGIFCAWNTLQPGVGLHLQVQDWADGAVSRLRALIDTLPFRAQGPPYRRPQLPFAGDGGRFPGERCVTRAGTLGPSYRHYLSDF